MAREWVVPGTGSSALGQQGAEADLMKNSLAGDGFGEHPDHETEHGGATVEPFDFAQLLLVDLAGGSGLKPLLIGPWTGDGHDRKVGCPAIVKLIIEGLTGGLSMW